MYFAFATSTLLLLSFTEISVAHQRIVLPSIDGQKDWQVRALGMTFYWGFQNKVSGLDMIGRSIAPGYSEAPVTVLKNLFEKNTILVGGQLQELLEMPENMPR
ncbi:hypothetical protein EV356DRAFT_535603 [Viridothelium virens]|uniref:Uncharacterized protein n=1 Tax=Viridothelium virens TaxID=1048519 RepID=A0A6A6H0F0_VIRVR|nr:hypothetical protein EV356DRAFT_535603 [Viridothelium virens]